jgi:hypothetical protein
MMGFHGIVWLVFWLHDSGGLEMSVKMKWAGIAAVRHVAHEWWENESSRQSRARRFEKNPAA